VIAAAGPSALWYLTRATGLVTLVLLTASVVIGILQVLRWTPRGSPRFVVVTLHRTISLLVVALLTVHVVTAVLDSFAPIRLLDAVLPFTGGYRPLWLGLGALACDLVIALTVTSLLRRRLGLGAWRAVHWLAYACWPVALVHGWGTGTDARTPWMLAITVACAAVVLGSIAWRLVRAGPRHARVRGAALGVCVTGAAAAAIWLAQGPLAGGWARRAGTPPRLLASAAPVPSLTTRPRRSRLSALQRPFTAGLTGSVRRGLSAGGMAVIDLRMRLTGGVPGILRVRIGGAAANGGGVLMRRSAVTLGPRSAPGELQGRIDALQGSSLEALVGASAGPAVRLRVDLALSTDTVRGTVSGSPVNGTAG
jgi:DMSO/TMAO reductase YedYZ heme-binding membrane subunit